MFLNGRMSSPLGRIIFGHRQNNFVGLAPRLTGQVTSPPLGTEAADQKQDGNRAYFKERKRPWIAEPAAQGKLDTHRGSADEHAQLVDNARKQATHTGRRKFVQVRGNDSEDTLNSELHHEGSCCQRQQRRTECTCGNGKQRDGESQHDGVATAKPLREVSNQQRAQYGSDVVQDGYIRNRTA